MTDLVTGIREWLKTLGDGVMDLVSVATVMIDEAYHLFDALGALASRYGWGLTPSIQIPVIFLLASAARDSRAPQHDIYLLVRDYLRNDGWSQLRRFADEMRDYTVVTPQRFKIVQDCLCAMSHHGVRGHNAANLVVPALFAQVDGMLTDLAFEAGIRGWSSSKNKRLVRTEFERVTYRFDRPTLDLLFDVMFAKAKSGVDVNGRKLNRRKILHAEWLEYGRIEHVLRTVLIVDFVGYVIEEYRQRKATNTWLAPMTLKSKTSWMLSESFVASVAGIARNRMTERVLRLPNLAVPSSGQLSLGHEPTS
jgi:hypothetical protein